MDIQQKTLLKKIGIGLGLGLLGLMIWGIAYDIGMQKGIMYERSLSPANRGSGE